MNKKISIPFKRLTVSEMNQIIGAGKEGNPNTDKGGAAGNPGGGEFCICSCSCDCAPPPSMNPENC